MVTGNKLFKNILLNDIVLSNKYPSDKYDILATLCSNDKAINVNIGNIITNIFSVILFAFDDRNTAKHTKKLHRTPKIIADDILNDIFVFAIFINEADITSFSGVLITSNVIISDPHKFPKYTISQFFNNCFTFICLFNSGITSNELPVNNSVFISITNINPIGNTNADNILLTL